MLAVRCGKAAPLNISVRPRSRNSAARALRSSYCLLAHGSVLLGDGLGEETLREIGETGSSASLDPTERAIVAWHSPRDLIRKHTGADTLSPGTAMYCGTPGAIGGIRPGTRFEMELEDPVLGRTLRHAYDIETLPVVS